jgi:hypothetical protein
MSRRQSDQANEGKSGFEGEWVREVGALRSLRSKMKLVAEIRQECTFYAKKRKGNGLRIVWRERLLWQESEFKTQRHRWCKS